MNAVTEMPAPLLFSDSAANKVKELITRKQPRLKLRVFVTGGGAPGFPYGFTFDEMQNEDDAVMEKHGVKLLIDPTHYPIHQVRRRDHLPEKAWERPALVRHQEPQRARAPAVAARLSRPASELDQPKGAAAFSLLHRSGFALSRARLEGA